MATVARIPAVKVARISGHGTHVGAVLHMVAANIAMPAVMQSGVWKTVEMVFRYTAKATVRDSGSAQLAAKRQR